MAKTYKKKEENCKDDQHKHNRNTRGINTKRQGVLWARRKFIDENNKVQKYEIRVPVGSQWDEERLSKKARENGLPEPFDALHLEWADELREYAEDINGVVERETLSSGRYNYALIIKDAAGDDEIVFEIESSQNLNFGRPKKFKKKKGKPRKDS